MIVDECECVILRPQIMLSIQIQNSKYNIFILIWRYYSAIIDCANKYRESFSNALPWTENSSKTTLLKLCVANSKLVLLEKYYKKQSSRLIHNV